MTEGRRGGNNNGLRSAAALKCARRGRDTRYDLIEAHASRRAVVANAWAQGRVGQHETTAVAPLSWPVDAPRDPLPSQPALDIHLGSDSSAPDGATGGLADLVAATARLHGSHGVVDLLVMRLTDRRVRRDTEIDQFLDRLKSACRQARRYRDAIPVLKRIAALNPARKHEVAAELALVHVHLGERDTALSLLESAVAAQRRLSTRKRSLAFCVVAEIAAAILRQPVLAQEIALMGRSAGQARPRTTA